MNTERIALSRPSITALELSCMADAAANGWGEHCYDYIEQFQRTFQQALNVPYAITASSCTGALHMGLAALEIGAGDEVILADSNWIATVAPVVHLGAQPVFVDILADTWCIDPDGVETAITPRTRAIIATHLYGSVCALARLQQIADRHGLVLIEDAAEAIGSEYQGQAVGTFGRFGCFSFHGSKTICTGEGGMLVTRDADFYDKVLTLSNHGRRKGQQRQFWPEVIGFKYKMSNLQAALGCAQTQRMAELVERKRQILAAYRLLLQESDGVKMNVEHPGTRIGAWMPTLVFSPQTGMTARRMVDEFQSRSIDGRVFFHPLSSLPSFGLQAGQPVAADIARRAVNLPSFHDMTDAQIERVTQTVKAALHAGC
ncbi:MAG TPA: DegT/DnrJ/EryC1/StrS family aminotransferase [Rhodoferax sp.]|nr:DegT/DnrJ/EryC1/StrS family aminotransferase [Rhodoferax sp.]